MKKLLIAFLICFCLTSCVEEFRGNYGVVENVELVHPYNGETPKWKYLVTVHHEGNTTHQYKIYTNNVYHPGDTIEMRLKPTYNKIIQPDTINDVR